MCFNVNNVITFISIVGFPFILILCLRIVTAQIIIENFGIQPQTNTIYVVKLKIYIVSIMSVQLKIEYRFSP